MAIHNPPGIDESVGADQRLRCRLSTDFLVLELHAGGAKGHISYSTHRSRKRGTHIRFDVSQSAGRCRSHRAFSRSSSDAVAWDKVSEALMAELMGVTARALQGRRSRGVIPADVWREIDGRVMYSLKRYEQWLDGCWPAFEAPASAKPRKLRQKRNPQNNGFRLV